MPQKGRKELTAWDERFKDNVRHLWIRMGLSQTAFARQFGVSRRTVIRWMNKDDLHMPTKRHLGAILTLMKQNGIFQEV